MKKLLKQALITILAILMVNCSKTPSKVSTQSDYPAPPVAVLEPDTLIEFGNQRIDNYFWLKDRNNPRVMEYLKAENAYCDTVMAHTKELQETLYKEMRARIKEDDQSVPKPDNGYLYYNRTENDKQYPIYCRKKGDTTAMEEILFDVNKMAENSQTYLFTGYEVSPDNKLAAYAYNTTGSYAQFNLKIRDLTSGTDFPEEIPNTQSFVWANDNKTIFYTIANESLRPYRLYRHELNSTKADVLVFEEKDELFNLEVVNSKNNEYIYLISSSFTSSEYRILPANNANGSFKIFAARQADVEYYLEHHFDKVFIRYKDKQNLNSKILLTQADNPGATSTWKEMIPHNPAVKIQDFDIFENYLTLFIRKNGLSGISIMNIASGKQKTVDFPEPVYVVNPIYMPDFKGIKYRYSYSSLNRPTTVYEYNMDDGSVEKLKEQEIPSGFNPDDYIVERLWATSSDSVKVPMAVVYKKSLKKDAGNPALLYGYGSYGYNTDANFRISIFSLVDRDFVFAIGQVRGGSEMGEQWYEDGKLMKKVNSFNDFIACAELLVKDKYTSTGKLAIQGGSAGGLLVAAVTNMRPDLFHVVLAEVPFVDVITTMQDKTLPLTTQEYEQWGNPGEEAAYKYMLTYSPYDNVRAKNYPNILATAGWNDSQVLYHEPAKWVAKLRALKTDNNIILLKTNLESGHGGATGRFDYLKEIAFDYSFIIDRMGL